MIKILCIYHAHCTDGFGAAWAVQRALGPQVEFLAANYGEEPPDAAGRHVAIVDFSYPRDKLEALAQRAASVMVLDHHKTAAEQLSGLPAPPAWSAPDFTGWSGLVAEFDMNRSGAGMAWDYFHNNDARPRLIAHIEDRDLWRFRIDGTREYHAALSSYPMDMETWNRLYDDHVDLITEGAGILRKHDKDVDALVAMTRRRMRIGGYEVPCANVPPVFASDAGNRMAQGEPFAAVYVDTQSGRLFSLRSTDAGLDVSAIAKSYGGGGHRNAAGFKAERGWEGDFGGMDVTALQALQRAFP